MKKLHITIFALLVVAFLVGVIIYNSVSTYAKYRSSTSQAGNIAVAKWDIEADDSENDSSVFNMTIGDTEKVYKLKITSTSEVKSNYSILITNAPAGLMVKLDNGTYKPADNGQISFPNAGVINATTSDVVKNHNLTFKVAIGSNAINNSNVNIDVVFTQVNPGE